MQIINGIVLPACLHIVSRYEWVTITPTLITVFVLECPRNDFTPIAARFVWKVLGIVEAIYLKGTAYLIVMKLVWKFFPPVIESVSGGYKPVCSVVMVMCVFML